MYSLFTSLLTLTLTVRNAYPEQLHENGLRYSNEIFTDYSPA